CRPCTGSARQCDRADSCCRCPRQGRPAPPTCRSSKAKARVGQPPAWGCTSGTLPARVRAIAWGNIERAKPHWQGRTPPLAEPGRDAFHRVPFFAAEVRDAVELVLARFGESALARLFHRSFKF